MEKLLKFSVVMSLCAIVCFVMGCCGYVSDLLGYTFFVTLLLSFLGFLVYEVYALTMWIKQRKHREQLREHREQWRKQLNREFDYIAEEVERLRCETKSFLDKRNPIFGTFTSDEFSALHDERQSYIDESRHLIDECVRVYDRINAWEADAMRYFDGYASEEARNRVKDDLSRMRELVSFRCNTINQAVMLPTTTTIVA